MSTNNNNSHIVTTAHRLPIFLTMFQNEYNELTQLLNAPPVEPFVYENPDGEDDEKRGKGGDASDRDDKNDKAGSDDDEPFYDAVSFDDLFHEHTQWLKRFEQLKPSYQACVDLAREAKEVSHELQTHLRKGKQKVSTSAKTWSLFDEISQGNEDDMYEKKKKQLEERLRDIETSLKRFHDDLPSRREKLDEWEQRVVAKWKQVSSLFGLYGVPMTKSSLSTLQWLHKKDVVQSGYLGLVDVGHYLCSALLPYRQSIMCGALVAQLATTWSVDWMASAHAFLSVELLNGLYPILRKCRTSDYVLRTDTLLAFLTMYNFDVDVLTNVGLCAAVQLWMVLCANDMTIHYPYKQTADGDDDDFTESEAGEDDDDESTPTSNTDSDNACVVETAEYSAENDGGEEDDEENDEGRGENEVTSHSKEKAE